MPASSYSSQLHLFPALANTPVYFYRFYPTFARPHTIHLLPPPNTTRLLPREATLTPIGLHAALGLICPPLVAALTLPPPAGFHVQVGVLRDGIVLFMAVLVLPGPYTNRVRRSKASSIHRRSSCHLSACVNARRATGRRFFRWCLFNQSCEGKNGATREDRHARSSVLLGSRKAGGRGCPHGTACHNNH